SCYLVVSSYDPNNIEASVEHIANGPFVESGAVIPDEWITYKVNFQNTGTAMALNIRIEDLIDSTTLDISTAKYVGASHACSMIKDNHLLKFFLNGIDLIDSTTNEELSHGWIMFKIKSKFSLSNGDQILNTAGIYFDNNPVVITNTNVLQYGTPEGLTSISSKQNIQVFPNPMEQQATLVLPKSAEQATLRIFNRLGSCVFQRTVSGQQIYLERNQLADGLYMIEVNDRGTIYRGKLTMH
ncbi:MAG TPA: T9SS type A sorting domain-containing protein, partial [Chitinophagaceae bacterium]|nr:T9SS type A sorting domain-containing protein [Chitinophagaceae bacterium]